MNGRPTILLAGAPATGKTTVRGTLRSLMRQRYGDILDISIDDVLHQLHTNGDLSGSHLSSSGGLVLNDWEGVKRHVFSVLLHERKRSLVPAILEVPTDDDWFREYLRDEQQARATLVIILRAALQTRMDRNRRRGSAAIPEPAIKAMPSELSPDVFDAVVATVRDLTILSTDRPLDQVIALVSEWALIRLPLDL